MTFVRAQAITPSDTANFANLGGQLLCDAIYCGGAGVVPVVFEDGSVVNMTAVAGGYLYVRAKRVNNTNVGASLMVALYAR